MVSMSLLLTTPLKHLMMSVVENRELKEDDV